VQAYHTRIHGGLKDGETPEIAYKNAKAPLLDEKEKRVSGSEQLPV
jgi:hypothetical protein